MSDLVIISNHDDVHAYLVGCALADLDYSLTSISQLDLPSKAYCTYASNAEADSVVWEDEMFGRREVCPKVIWNRRRPRIQAPTESDVRDHKFIKNSSTKFARWVFNENVLRTRWVNSPELATRADNKLIQIASAKRAGLATPETIVSNNPSDIRMFVKSHEHEQVIMKPLLFGSWLEDETINVPYTTVISIEDLDDSQSLSFAPMIYQKRVQKKFELRINIFGSRVIAAKIRSQENDITKVDMRADLATNDNVEPYTLPQSLEEKLLKLMSDLGLVFGCVDMAVDNEGQFVFFEINEMGQFLWLEHHCPELKLLKEMSLLLTEGIRMPQNTKRERFEEISFEKYFRRDQYDDWMNSNQQKMNVVHHEPL